MTDCKDLGGDWKTCDSREDALALYVKVYAKNGLRRIG